MKKENRITEAEIESLVDQFYVKVREDEEIGPLFNRRCRIGTPIWHF